MRKSKKVRTILITNVQLNIRVLCSAVISTEMPSGDGKVVQGHSGLDIPSGTTGSGCYPEEPASANMLFPIGFHIHALLKSSSEPREAMVVRFFRKY
jgi:hypothetical protein